MRPIVLCIASDSTFTEAITLHLEESGAEVFVKHDVQNGLVLISRFGEEAKVVIVDEPTDFVLKAQRATEARFFGFSAHGEEALEALKAAGCHEAYDALDLVPAVEAYLLSVAEENEP